LTIPQVINIDLTAEGSGHVDSEGDDVSTTDEDEEGLGPDRHKPVGPSRQILSA
jgi:hypothetical protein